MCFSFTYCKRRHSSRSHRACSGWVWKELSGQPWGALSSMLSFGFPCAELLQAKGALREELCPLQPLKPSKHKVVPAPTEVKASV